MIKRNKQTSFLMTRQVCKKIFVQLMLLLFFQNVFSQEIVLPNGITVIGEFEFMNENISEINIPNSVEFIEECAFASNNLKSVLFPDNIISIGVMAFAWNKLETVIFSENIYIIDNYSFYCNLLERIELPKNVVEIGSGAFGKNNLISIFLPESLYEIKDWAFADNQLKEVIIPNSVRYIGKYAFYRNELNNVELPQNINLGKGAFQNNQLTTIIIPKGIFEIPAFAFFGNILSDVAFTESVREIGYRAFEYNELNRVILPKSIKKIEERAFNNNLLTEITIGENVSIGAKAMGIHSDKFIEAYETNKRKAGIYTYDKITKEWIYQRIKSESLIFQLFAGEYSVFVYGGLSILASLIFFLLSILFFKKNQKSRPLYSNSNEIIDAMRGEKDSPMQILWNDEIVENVRFVELTFWNDGKKPIRQNDIPIPITIRCKNEDIKILDCTFSSKSKNRKSILLEGTKNDKEIRVSLKNDDAFGKNEGFKLYITYTSEHAVEDGWVVDADIIEGHTIRNVRNISFLERLGKTFGYVLAILGFGLLPLAIIVIVEYFWGFYWNFYWAVYIIWIIVWGVFHFFTTEKKKYKTPKWN